MELAHLHTIRKYAYTIWFSKWIYQWNVRQRKWTLKFRPRVSGIDPIISRIFNKWSNLYELFSKVPGSCQFLDLPAERAGGGNRWLILLLQELEHTKTKYSVFARIKLEQQNKGLTNL